ncbi:uncharacterized protein LOC122247408 [Penaeus japonicus]|uniref:uncharacterized protein LOC122247408 n=1 Tax=Penaeus japonicus TaxID=27405 RepID=UPI001C70E9A2|nr:uncharacterized protein LOC122247408 [Penaeus japonicus]
MAPSGGVGVLCRVLQLAFLLQACPVRSYIFKTGACPSVKPLSNFAFNQFVGTWHVIQSSNTASRCHSLSFSQSSGKFFLDMNKQIFSLRAAGIVHNLRFQAQIYPNPKEPATMVLRIPSSLYQDVSYQILSTDYTTWAVAWSCKPMVFGHLESALIMARSKELSLSELRNIRLNLQSAGVSVDELSSVQQTECNPDLDGGRFTLDLASSLANTLVDWTALIPTSTIPGLSPGGCFVQEGDFYIYQETCNATASNVIFDGTDISSSDGGNEGGDAGDEYEYYYYYDYYDDATTIAPPGEALEGSDGEAQLEQNVEEEDFEEYDYEEDYYEEDYYDEDYYDEDYYDEEYYDEDYYDEDYYDEDYYDEDYYDEEYYDEEYYDEENYDEDYDYYEDGEGRALRNATTTAKATVTKNGRAKRSDRSRDAGARTSASKPEEAKTKDVRITTVDGRKMVKVKKEKIKKGDEESGMMKTLQDARKTNVNKQTGQTKGSEIFPANTKQKKNDKKANTNRTPKNRKGKNKKRKKSKRKNRKRRGKKPPVAQLIMVSPNLQRFLALRNINVRKFPVKLSRRDLQGFFQDRQEKRMLRRHLRVATKKWRKAKGKLKIKGKKKGGGEGVRNGKGPICFHISLQSWSEVP